MILDSKSRKLLKLITSEKPPETTRLFTFDYVMNKLNISRQAVYNNKNKALKNLRKMLEQ